MEVNMYKNSIKNLNFNEVSSDVAIYKKMKDGDSNRILKDLKIRNEYRSSSLLRWSKIYEVNDFIGIIEVYEPATLYPKNKDVDIHHPHQINVRWDNTNERQNYQIKLFPNKITSLCIHMLEQIDYEYYHTDFFMKYHSNMFTMEINSISNDGIDITIDEAIKKCLLHIEDSVQHIKKEDMEKIAFKIANMGIKK
jgi:hypothetical protein